VSGSEFCVHGFPIMSHGVFDMYYFLKQYQSVDLCGGEMLCFEERAEFLGVISMSLGFNS
jgi:hypothetical protein